MVHAGDFKFQARVEERLPSFARGCRSTAIGVGKPVDKHHQHHALKQAVEALSKKHDRVWVPTRLQIAEHWHANLAHLAENAADIG